MIEKVYTSVFHTIQHDFTLALLPRGTHGRISSSQHILSSFSYQDCELFTLRHKVDKIIIICINTEK